VRGLDNYQGDTLRTNDPEREAQRNVVANVIHILPDRADYMPVLQALLAPGKPVRVRRGQDRTSEAYAARKAWLERCRAWLIEQGLMPFSTQIRESDQRRYEAATGDVWSAVREGME
jgi:hypothetical protein